MPRLTRTRKLMRFVRKTHHHRRDLAEFERAKHFLAAGTGRRAIIRFTENEHHRRFHILDVSKRGAGFELLLVIKWRRLEPCRLKQREVSGVPPGFTARDVAL